MFYDFKPLEEILENRLITDKFECALYSADLAPLPKVINLLSKARPYAVFHPENSLEISENMKFANKKPKIK